MGSLLEKRGFYIIVYVIAVNIYGFALMGLDKRKARKRTWRIPERSLFLTAFLGGAAGVLMGMRAFHHKTLHNKFRYGIPALLILNIAALIYASRFI